MTTRIVKEHTRKKKGGQRKCVKVAEYSRKKRFSGSGMKLITLHLTPERIEALDKLVPEFFPNRAEAIRTGVNDLLDCYSKIQRRSL